MIWITGDTHRVFDWLPGFCREKNTTAEDVLIILGDAGINTSRVLEDDGLKERLAALPLTLFCIHGNHERRPEHLSTYALTPWQGGLVWREAAYPTLLFARDGEVYDLGGVQTLVIGGAYSVDKVRRQIRGWDWWADEQPDEAIRERTEEVLERRGWRIDAVLSHTCPRRYEPVEMFLMGIDQSRVDKSTEDWLDTIEARLDYRRWFCGHFHTDKAVRYDGGAKCIRFLYLDVRPWPSGDCPESGEVWRRWC